MKPQLVVKTENKQNFHRNEVFKVREKQNTKDVERGTLFLEYRNHIFSIFM